MKVSPVPTGSGVPAQSSIDTGNSEAKDRAKKIAQGSEAAVSQAQESVKQFETKDGVKTIKMRTNFTTPSIPFEVPEAEAAAPAVEAASSTVDAGAGTSGEETHEIDPQVAELAKQRRALQVREEQQLKREKEWEAKQNPAPSSEEVIERLKKNPLQLMREHGVTYDQLTESILQEQAGSGPEIQNLRAELKALKEEFTKNLSDRDSRTEEQALNEMEREARLIAKDGDAYEFIRTTNSYGDVKEAIKRHYKRTGEVLDVREVMDLVEAELQSDFLQIAKGTKAQSKLSPSEQRAEVTAPQDRRRTLTNADTASLATMDRKTRAMLAMQGRLQR